MGIKTIKTGLNVSKDFKQEGFLKLKSLQEVLNHVYGKNDYGCL